MYVSVFYNATNCQEGKRGQILSSKDSTFKLIFVWKSHNDNYQFHGINLFCTVFWKTVTVILKR